MSNKISIKENPRNQEKQSFSGPENSLRVFSGFKEFSWEYKKINRRMGQFPVL